MSRPVMVLVAVLVLAAALTWWIGRDDPPTSGLGGRAAPETPPPEEGEVADGTVDDEETAPPPTAKEEAAGSGPWRLVVDVRGPDDEPITATEVVFRDSEGEGVASGETDVDGTVTLRVRGTGAVCVDEPPRLASGAIEGLVPPASGELRVRLELAPGSTIDGVVIQQDGATPAGGTRVILIADPSRPWRPDLGAETGADGRFVIDYVPPGSHELMLIPAKDEHGAAPAERPVVTQGSGGLRIVLEPLARVTIRVVEQGSGPERSITSLLLHDADGKRFRSMAFQGERPEGMVTWLRPDVRYSVVVRSPGWVQEKPFEFAMTPEQGERLVDVPIRPDERPKATLRLVIEPVGDEIPGRLYVGREVASDLITGGTHDVENGVVELKLPAGRNVLNVSRPWGARPETAPWLPLRFTVELSGGERRDHPVRLKRGGWLRIRFAPGTTSTGCRLGRVGEEVRYMHKRPGKPEDGGLWFHGAEGKPLAPGRWNLEWLRKEGPVRRTVEIRPGAVTEVSFGTD